MLFDKAYDDLGIEPLMTKEYPTLSSGSENERTLVLYNDDYRGTELAVDVRLVADGKSYAGGKKMYHLALGEHRDIPISFQVPAVRDKVLELILSVEKEEGPVQRGKAVPCQGQEGTGGRRGYDPTG